MNDEQIEKRRQWMVRYYSQLVGCQINRFVIGADEDFGEDFPMFDITTQDGKQLQITIQRDEEGNGPGFIDGLPLPNPASSSTGNEGYMAATAARLLSTANPDFDPDMGNTSDGRIVATVKINDQEAVEIGEDPNNPARFAIWLLDWTIEDPEPAFVLPNLDQRQMIKTVKSLHAGTEGVKAELMLDHAERILKGAGGERWHGGGGIWLIATFGNGKRITAAPDEEGAATYSIEVTDEETGESLYVKDGLTPSTLTEEWLTQTVKHTM